MLWVDGYCSVFPHIWGQPNQGGQGQTTVVDDEEELYCCPVSDVSELYKQLSSKKYREIKRHQIQYDAIMNCVIPFND